MFYMQLLMNKRGPLAKIWLAAHWDKKVTKANIFECNLETTIEKMLSPKFKIALRTSGHLLLGVVRIYHRKTKYLLEDCNEALLKMQTAFRPGLVDLPKAKSEANYEAITLPEEFHDFETQLPDVNAIDVAQHFTLNQSRLEDITLVEEDYRLLHGDFFGGDIEMARQISFFSGSVLATPSDILADHSSLNITANKNIDLDIDLDVLNQDGFGDEGVAEDMIDNVLGTEQNSLIELFDGEREINLPPNLPVVDTVVDNLRFNQDTRNRSINETTLLSNEEEGFLLEPIEDAALVKKHRCKRKRKLLVDAVKEISKCAMENCLKDYKDTLTPLIIAPPTKRLMILHELGSVDKLMNKSTQPLFNEDLQKLFSRCLRGERKSSQQDINVKERNKEQTDKNPKEEVPNNLQDSVYLETLSLLKYDRKEKSSSIPSETIEAANIMSTCSDASLMDISSRHESDNERAAKENEFQGNDLENEERRRRMRTTELLNTFKHMDQTGTKSFSFLAICRDKKNKQVAGKFYSLLVLKKQEVIEVAQPAPYADIIVTVGPKFYFR